MSKIGFVILNYNTWELAEGLALKVANFNNIDKIVVVDNISTDASFEHLKQLQSEKVEVVQSDKNGGYSYGNNIGARKCLDNNIEILFISNPDIEVEEVDVDKIIRVFENTDYSMLSGVEYDIKGNINKPVLSKRMTYIDDLLDCFFFGRKILRSRYLQLNCKSLIQDTEMVKGSFLAVRIKDFEKIGLFDDNVFLYCEERIISKRFSDAGMKIGVVTDAKYQHIHSVSIKKAYKTVVSQMKLLYTSRMYYQCNYGGINNFQKLLLSLSMKLSLLEYQMRDCIKKVKYKN